MTTGGLRMAVRVGPPLAALVVLAGGAGQAAAQGLPPELPDGSGWGVHVLSVSRAPDGALWVGTYGEGIFVWRPDAAAWEQHRADTGATSISWDFVHAFGFQDDGTVWYGTLGNGWGRSRDGGRTWANWTFDMLGPEYQYVAPDGIVVRNDTVYVATADGIKLTGDGGDTWRVITDSAGALSATHPVAGRIGNQYILALGLDGEGDLWLSHLHGVERSRDGGRTWEGEPVRLAPGEKGRGFVPGAMGGLEPVFAAPVRAACPEGDPACAASVSLGRPPLTTSAPVPDADPPAPPRHTWFARPLLGAEQPFIDQTYRYGATMGGNFQQHQGVEFNAGEGTPVHAIGPGVVAFAGQGEAGALTVAIRHDRMLEADGRRYTIYSVYYHHTALRVRTGQRVVTGTLIGLVGNTGRATNDHLHLEVHATPVDSLPLVADPNERYPPYTSNPELWIAPLPGTGMVAGQVWDGTGSPLPQVRVYGLAKPNPRETPFSFAETYGEHARGTPAYREHFAVGDVPPGRYLLGVEIDGRPVYRRVVVEAGRLTWVEFRP